MELRRGGAILKRRWWVVVLLTALGGVVAGLYALSSPTTYTATTLVNLSVIADEPFTTQRSASGLIDPATETQLARSSAVLRSAAITLGGGTTIAQVRRATTVRVLPEATVGRVSYTASTMAAAIEGADAVGQAYVDYRTGQAQAKVDRIVAKLNDRQASFSKELATVNNALANHPSAAQRAAATSQREIIQSQLSATLSQLSHVASIDTSGGYVITKADDSAISVQPHTRLLVQIGVALGLALGLIGAFLLEALDRRVVTASDVAKLNAGRLLARLDDHSRAVPARGADEEAYRLSAEQLLVLRAAGHSAFTIVDLTRLPQPAVAANLALALAAVSGTQVTGVFTGSGQPTAELLTQQCDGRMTAMPLAGMDGAAVSIGRRAKSAADDTATVIALPSDAAGSHLVAAVRQAPAVILVLERRHTRGREINAMVETLTAVGGVVVGSILAPPAPRSLFPASRGLRRRKHSAPVPARHGA